MKKALVLCFAILITGSAAQAQRQPVAPIPAPNGQLVCPGGYHGPIRSTPGGAWVCLPN